MKHASLIKPPRRGVLNIKCQNDLLFRFTIHGILKILPKNSIKFIILTILKHLPGNLNKIYNLKHSNTDLQLLRVRTSDKRFNLSMLQLILLRTNTSQFGSVTLQLLQVSRLTFCVWSGYLNGLTFCLWSGYLNVAVFCLGCHSSNSI